MVFSPENPLKKIGWKILHNFFAGKKIMITFAFAFAMAG